ncbi:SAF domain-containing protein [Paenibacillus barcinonensis]|uniref:SAF domain-containing protein n=1 Tax=Paenibacillus barcinonensis TaxID=198119 RepID=A0A2V4V908_PAEBA|nr:SAF domain-containing protein [Paenibacillus barcinonensis]PYE49245.1 SAF domain-containing protein [Paenibacillus barcinonensis]QKS55476.1 SAF domain-containing protein [Paenibacillus barcinonensis]
MSKLRKQSRERIYAGLIGAGAVAVIFAGYVIYQVNTAENVRSAIEARYLSAYEEKQADLLQQWNSGAQGWVTIRDIEAGEPVMPDDLKLVAIPDAQAPRNLWSSTKKLQGQVAKIELKKGTAITTEMVYEDTPAPSDLRNRELQVVLLPSSLVKGDMIDIRIQFPTGQDYILLSKKKVERLNAATLWVTMTEDEILSLSSAIVDAYLHKASIYALTYVEPQFQTAAIPTYPANAEVLKLLESDPNLVRHAEQELTRQVRSSLESSLAASMSAPSKGIEQDVAQSSVTYNKRPSVQETSSAGVIWNDGAGSASNQAGNASNVPDFSILDEQQQLLTGNE